MHIFKGVMMHLGLISDVHVRELKFMIKLQVKCEIESCYKS